jgi:hypothetical protein
LIPNVGQLAVMSASLATPPLTAMWPQKWIRALPGQDVAPAGLVGTLEGWPAGARVEAGADAAGDGEPEQAATSSAAHIAIASGMPRRMRRGVTDEGMLFPPGAHRSACQSGRHRGRARIIAGPGISGCSGRFGVDPIELVSRRLARGPDAPSRR